MKDIDSEIINLLYLYYEHLDREIRDALTKKIIEKIPFGRNPYYYIELIEESIVRVHLRAEVGTELNYLKLVEDFKLYMEDPNNLMKGSYLVSRFSDAIFISFEDYQKKFFLLVEEFLKTYPNFIDFQTEEQLNKIVEFLYCYKEYQGNFEDYHTPENSFINYVLESKKGIPVSLSVITLLFYEILKKTIESKFNYKVQFFIHGVNLPGHFILFFSSKDFHTFFDPFHFGNKITYIDCVKHLLRLGYKESPEVFLNPPVPKIISRMLYNLHNIYTKRNETKKRMTIESLLKILNNLVQVEDQKY